MEVSDVPTENSGVCGLIRRRGRRAAPCVRTGTVPFSKGTHSRFYADGVRHRVSAGGLGDVRLGSAGGGDLAQYLLFAVYQVRF